jgi:ERCC4-type nuclease
MSSTVGELAMIQGIGWKGADQIKELLDTRFTRNPETKEQMRLEE